MKNRANQKRVSIHFAYNQAQAPDQFRKVFLNFNDEEAAAHNKALGSNVIRTSKFTIINFLPIGLFVQFSKASNIYFLVVMFMQMVDMISISEGKPAMAVPLTFVVVLSMIKDAFEDYKRHQADNGENNSQCQAFNNQTRGFVAKKWKEVHPGDVLRVQNNEMIPADMVILNTSDEKGTAYVETKNLDGETNLKLKSAQKELHQMFYSETKLGEIKSVLQCELPNNAIYNFEGFMDIDEKTLSLGIDNVLLRGCHLRNSEYVLGLVVYQGHDSKIMRNFAKAKYKFSNLEITTNRLILITLATQLLLAIIGAIIGSIWNIQEGIKTTYLGNELIDPSEQRSMGYYFIQLTGTWILIFTNFVPISLLVTLELVKFWQGMFMTVDYMMADPNQDVSMRAQSSNLNEELGQIEYIFSDKTGTLTCNIMEFKKFTAGMVSFGTGKQATEPQLSNVNFHDPKLQDCISQTNTSDHDYLIKVLIFLSVCHTIVVDRRNNNYNAASPDELALVNAAKQFGFEFMGQDKDENLLIQNKHKNETLKYKLLNVCEFNSTRKRMSVIVQTPTGSILLLCKGADSVIKARLSQESLSSEIFKKTQAQVDIFAEEGLRTLFLAERTISQEEYRVWNVSAMEAKVQISNREEKVAEIDELIEVDLTLIGSTAIEDKLQENVATTIQFIKSAEVKLWVLTGDKIETAINIGFSAGLLDSSMTQFLITETKQDELEKKLEIIVNQIKESASKKAIVVSGEALTIIEANTKDRDVFLLAAEACEVVLACRVSPKQKADIVNMVRKKYPSKRTLSIGDGANDVSMILRAHVGIGIFGKEGQQAARSADFAIGQFQFLKPLLFIHGREAYRRNSFLILYNFYKNITYVTAQFWFGFMSSFQGQPLYEPFIYQLFNVMFTSLPIMWFALFDFEYPKDEFLKQPSLYSIGINNKCFSKLLYLKWVIYALIHGLFVYIFNFFGIFYHKQHLKDGKDFSLWQGGHLTYGTCVAVINMMIMFRFNNWTGGGEFLAIGSTVVYYIVLLVENYLSSFPQVYRMFPSTFNQPIVYLSFLLTMLTGAFVQILFNRGHFLKCQHKMQKEKIENNPRIMDGPSLIPIRDQDQSHKGHELQMKQLNGIEDKIIDKHPLRG